MGSPLSNIPGIGGLFGGGGDAKESTQKAHMALHKVQWGLQIAEEVQQTYSLIEHLGNTPVSSLIREATGIQRDVELLSRQLETIFDDQFGSGDLTSDIQYKQRQIDRAVARLEEIHESVGEYAQEQVAIRNGTAEAVGVVRNPETGVLGATQGVAEISAMNVAATQNNSRILGDMLAIEAARESRDMEDRVAATLRACKVNEDNEAFQREHCS